ncbi:PhzF family phenazine biosynthesis isomerase [Blastococcus sp. SYSU D00813]
MRTARRTAEDVVRDLLGDVRSGRAPERATDLLAPRVLAHQGRPGAEHGVVERTPAGYADHVRVMLAASGPWRFDWETTPLPSGDVAATWTQRRTGRHPVVEHGRAVYRVRDDRVTEYWVEYDRHAGPCPAPAGCPEVLRYAAFADDPAGGNPAGVVPDARGMTAERMLAVAAGVGYSETAFLVPGADGHVGVRYFSPRAEVAFCGHATVAAAVVLAEREGPGRRVFDTAAGPVEVVTRRTAGGAWQASLTSVPPVTVALPDADRAALLAALRWSDADLDPALPPRVSSAGNRHPVLAAATRARLADLDYDYPALDALMAARGWTTVALVWRESETVFVARNPFPPGGVVEDPATGAAAAALGGYLRAGGHVPLPARVTVRQGEDMGRPGVLLVDVPADPAAGIRVTGTAVPVP